jgi:hypothetical protein
MIIRWSQKAEVYWRWLRKCTILVQLLQWRYFWYFWLTIQNTTTSQARSLFHVIAVFISFYPWRAAVAGAVAVDFCCCCCARPRPTPLFAVDFHRPPFGGREVPKKGNRKMNSNDKILCDNVVNNQNINVLKSPQKIDWSRSSPTTLTSWSIWVIGISTFIHTGRLWGFKRRCKELFMCVFVNPQFKLTQLGPAEVPSNVISFLNVNSEISKGRGLLVMI